MSIVYHIPTDSDELLVSTMRDRAEPLPVGRDGKVSLWILDERWPFACVQIYCDGQVDDDPKLVTDVMMAVGGRMLGTTLPEAARPAVEAMAKSEDRVVQRCRPHATFAQPSRHLHHNDQDRTSRSPTGSPPACPGTPATRGLVEPTVAGAAR
jgi:hypothetical protein